MATRFAKRSWAQHLVVGKDPGRMRCREHKKMPQQCRLDDNLVLKNIMAGIRCGTQSLPVFIGDHEAQRGPAEYIQVVLDRRVRTKSCAPGKRIIAYRASENMVNAHEPKEKGNVSSLFFKLA